MSFALTRLPPGSPAPGQASFDCNGSCRHHAVEQRLGLGLCPLRCILGDCLFLLKS